MADIDLIPADYRNLARLRRRLPRVVIAVIAVVLIIGVARFALYRLVSFENAHMAQLQTESNVAARSNADADSFRQRKALAEKQLAELDELRGRDRLSLLLRAIDVAYSDSIWVDHVRFFRGDIPAGETSSLPGVGRSGVIVVPKANVPVPGTAPASAAGEQRAEIVGHATSHTKLAEFMRSLASQPGIAEVRLVDTGLGSYANVPVIDLTLVLVIGGKAWRAQ